MGDGDQRGEAVRVRDPAVGILGRGAAGPPVAVGDHLPLSIAEHHLRQDVRPYPTAAMVPPPPLARPLRWP